MPSPHIRRPHKSVVQRNRANAGRLAWLATGSIVLVMALLARPATAFDFFQTFFGGQNQGQGHQREHAGDRGQSSGTNVNECADYICPLPASSSPSASPNSPKICVLDPRDCPCPRPALETKCVVGDWYTCVPNSIVANADGCKAYLTKLNGAGSFNADASGKRSEL